MTDINLSLIINPSDGPTNITITPTSDGKFAISISPSSEAPPWAIQLLSQIGVVIQKENQIMTAQTDALDQAEAAAATNASADDSAEALLLTLVQLYTDAVANSTDPQVTARIVALGETITARAGKLSAAVVANTPAAPPPPVV